MANTHKKAPRPAHDRAYFVVAWRKGKGFEFGEIPATPEFSRDLVTLTETIDASFEEREAVAYSVEAEVELGEQYMHAAPGERAMELRRQLISVVGMETVDPRDLAKRKNTIAFYAIVRGESIEDRTAYVRHMNPMRLAKSGFWVAGFSNALKRTTETLLVMDQHVDLVLRADDIQINDRRFFESLFYELTEIDSQIGGWMDTALSALPVEDETIEMLTELCRDKKTSRRKLMAIRERGHLAEGVDMGLFRKALKDNGLPAARFVRNGKIYAEESDGPELLKVLNEDVFLGCLTGEPLEAERKRKRPNPAA